MTAPKRKLRWFQYSLRTLLVFVTLCAIPCSWLAVKIRKARDQRAAVDAVIELGGFVTYDYMLDQSGKQQPNAQPSGPAWLQNLLGTDFFNEVVRVNLDSTEVTDGRLEHLKGLTRLQWLNLFNTEITDAGLEHLQAFTQLQRLELGGAANVTDSGLEHLKNLPLLQGVFLGGTQVTDEGVKKLQQALPNCQIGH